MKTYVVAGAGSQISQNMIQHLIDKYSGSEEDLRVLAYSRQNDLPPLTGVEYYQWDVNESFPGLPADTGEIDGLVYSPGTVNLKPFKSMKEELFVSDMQVNFFGALPLLKAALPLMKHGGDVLFFSSVAAGTGMAFHSSISAAKAAVEGFVRSMAAEYAGSNIRFNSLALSLTDTPMVSRLLSSDDKKQAMAERHPLGRYGNPVEIGKIAADILSGVFSWMTGQVIHLDGGISSVR